MSIRIGAAAILLAWSSALCADDTPYQLELVPAGSVISTDAPASRGNTYLFHRYPAGTFVSIRKAEVSQIHRISPRAADATNPAKRIIAIDAVALESTTQAGPTRLGFSAGRSAAQPE